MSAKKVLTLVICMVLVAALSVVGTLAYLTSTDSVQNSFAAGKVIITMDEVETNEYGVATDPTKRGADNDYLLVPGREYTKDPTIHVDASSESCWLFVKVENGIVAIETEEDGKTIHEQILANEWAELTEGSGIYYMEWEKGEDAYDVPVFQNFTVAKTADNDDIDTHEDAEVNVTAYAVQMAGFEGKPAAAWAAYFVQNPPVNP